MHISHHIWVCSSRYMKVARLARSILHIILPIIAGLFQSEGDGALRSAFIGRLEHTDKTKT